MRHLVTAFLVGIAASVSSAQIVNGSFESTEIGAPSRVSISNLTDWTAQGGQMLHERGVNGTSAIAAHSGNQFVSMGHNGAQNDILFQNISTVPGATYTVSFYVHCIQGNALQTVVGSALAGDVLGSVDGNVSSITQGWVNFTFDFVATQPQTEIRFTHTLGAGNANVAIDSVTVVPTPGALALLGLGGLVATRRRR